jgi:hypothetical protein
VPLLFLLTIYYNKIIFNNIGAPKHDIIKEKTKRNLC